MKQAIGAGVLTVLFLTVLAACGKRTESNQPLEEQNMTFIQRKRRRLTRQRRIRGCSSSRELPVNGLQS